MKNVYKSILYSQFFNGITKAQSRRHHEPISLLLGKIVQSTVWKQSFQQNKLSSRVKLLVEFYTIIVDLNSSLGGFTQDKFGR